MKVRRGFVSNSSSSSFVISNTIENGELSNCFDIAIYMIGCRDFGDEDKLIKKLEKALEDKIITKDTNLMFHTCNYDTYIMKDYNWDKIYISTCNNHNFDSLNNYYSNDDGELADAKRDNCRFYYIEGGVFVTYIPYSDIIDSKRCSKGKTAKNHYGCFGEKFKADDGKEYCIECELEKFKVKPKDIKINVDKVKSILKEITSKLEELQKEM